MKNSQKGFVVPLLIAVIALLVIGGGIYYYSRQNSTSASQNTQTPVNLSPASQQTQPVQSATSTASTVPSAVWHASLVGGQLSDTDKASIVSASVNMVQIVNSGDVASFRKYAAALVPPQQLAQLQKTSDQQVLSLMKLIGPLMAKELTSDAMVSSEATWTIQDADHVQIVIQTSPNSSMTIRAIKQDGIWY